MKRSVAIVLMALTLAPAVAGAQSFSLAARGGTLGVGGELGLGITPLISVRAGAGFIPLEVDATYSELDYTVKPTSPLLNVGVDFHPFLGGFRIGAGLLFVQNATELDATYTGSYRIGDETYTGTTELHGDLDHGDAAPYVILGIGRAAGGGTGLFLDLGAAFLGEPSLTLTASGDATNAPNFQQNLEKERQQAEQDARDYLRILPIVSIGFRFGF